MTKTGIDTFLAARLREKEDFLRIARLAAKHRERMRREIDAERAIMELHKVYSEPELWGSSHSDPAMRGQPTGGTTYWCEICDYDRDYGHIGGPQEGCETLRHLVAVYSDRPDYDPAWAPGG